MRFSPLAAITLAAMVSTAAPTVTQAAIPTTMTSSQPYGLRGQVIPFTVTLKYNGLPLANQPVYFYDWSDRRPNGSFRGVAWTNSQGKATLTYTIPTNVNEDNVYLEGVFFGDSTYNFSYAYRRIQIGHPYP